MSASSLDPDRTVRDNQEFFLALGAVILGSVAANELTDRPGVKLAGGVALSYVSSTVASGVIGPRLALFLTFAGAGAALQGAIDATDVAAEELGIAEQPVAETRVERATRRANPLHA